MGPEITVKRFEVGVRALAGHGPQLHELAGGVVDEHQQGAGLAALLKPAMVAPIDLDQLAVTLAPQSRLVERPSLCARQPEAVRHHPSSQRLSTHPKVMLLQKHFGRQRWSEVGIPGPDQLDRVPPNAFVPTPVRGPATSLVDQPAPAIRFIPRQQPVRLALAHSQYGCCRSHGTTPSPHITQHFDPLQIAFAHRYPSHP